MKRTENKKHTYLRISYFSNPKQIHNFIQFSQTFVTFNKHQNNKQILKEKSATNATDCSSVCRNSYYLQCTERMDKWLLPIYFIFIKIHKCFGKSVWIREKLFYACYFVIKTKFHYKFCKPPSKRHTLCE